MTEYHNSAIVLDSEQRGSLKGGLHGGVGGKPAGKTGKRGPGAGPEGEGIEGTFHRLPTMQASDCATRLVELTHRTLMEAEGAEARSSTVLYHTARDILEMFRYDYKHAFASKDSVEGVVGGI